MDAATVLLVLLGTLTIAGAAAHLAADAATQAAPWAGNDTALMVFIGQEMEAGARLYVDWTDPNPPSIFLIALAAARAAVGGMPTIFAFDLIVLLAAAAGLAVLTGSLRAMPGDRWVVTFTAAAYLLFVLKPGSITRDFGQREHLFALLLVPELFALASGRRMRLRPLWCAAIAFAAMMKPQFVLIVVAAEILALRQRPVARGELLGFAAGAAAPGGLLWLHSPQSFAALFTQVLQLHLSGQYGLLNRGPEALLERGPLIMLVAAGLAVGALIAVRGRDPQLRRTATLGIVAIVVALAGVITQQKYYPYHFTPMFGPVIVCGGWALAVMASARARWLLPLGAVGCVGVAMLVFHLDVSRNGDPLPVRLGAAVQGTSRILVLSSNPHGLCTPYTGAPRCLGPMAFEPTLPALASAPDPQRAMAPLREGLRRRIAEERPEVIAISTTTVPPAVVAPALLLFQDAAIFPAGDYVPLSEQALEPVRARGWIFLRRHDVQETLR